MRTIFIYHKGDLDGQACAAIARAANAEYELVPAEYGDDLHPLLIGATKAMHLIMADFSLPFEQMLELGWKTNLTLIDHHWGIIKQCLDYASKQPLPFTTFLGDEANSKAACELVWEYFFQNQPIPMTIKLLSAWDTWHHDRFPDVGAFQMGARYYLPTIDNPNWRDITHPRTPDTVPFDYIRTGTVLQTWMQNSGTSRVKDYGFDITFEGYKTKVVNTTSKGSQMFDEVCDESYVLRMVFCMLPNRIWKFSIYTTRPEIDVSVIAKKYGGGGHKQAAGFTWDSKTPLPF
jgi:uncharacterized protein